MKTYDFKGFPAAPRFKFIGPHIDPEDSYKLFEISVWKSGSRCINTELKYQISRIPFPISTSRMNLMHRR